MNAQFYLTGPGGEDLEGGYYDAGDNLKVVCYKFYEHGSLISYIGDAFKKCISDCEAQCHEAGYITIMYHLTA